MSELSCQSTAYHLRTRWPLPRYSTLTSIVNCPGPVDFAVYVVDLPASDAALPVANW